MSISIISIVGARPQFVKAAAVSRAIVRHNKACPDDRITEKIVHTGQHYDTSMSPSFFDELEIPDPVINLTVGSGRHGAQTALMLERIESVVLEEKPSCVIVFGDANSTVAGALAACKLNVPVAHVESGLRCHNRRIPEEINRVLTDHMSDLIFCPTQTAVKNLAAEGISQNVHLVGDVMYDCALFYAERANAISQEMLRRFDVRPKSYLLATVHRAENADDPVRLAEIFGALDRVSAENAPVLLPLHPRTKKMISTFGIDFGEYVKAVPPVSYLEMLALEMNASAILTDSGGVQREAYWFKVPCVTLRDETEWPETLGHGWNRLAGIDCSRIAEAVDEARNCPDSYDAALFGDGRCAEQICRILVDACNKWRKGKPEQTDSSPTKILER